MVETPESNRRSLSTYLGPGDIIGELGILKK